jgi:general stress protein YciG
VSGTISGGKLAAKTNKEKYGEDFAKRLGQMGGMKKVKKGFATNPELARKAGSKGGTISRRKPKKK